jgi:gamma-glutamyltranspeptidase / glutathione hydrolase
MRIPIYFRKISRRLAVFFAFRVVCALVSAGDLSPAKWNVDERAALEQLELRTVPSANRVVEGGNGLVASTMSPIAIRVGLDVLKHGGTAADAATAVALTEATTALGSFVSYAGIAQLVYFEASSGKVYSMDAGWASYLGETDPKSIPAPSSLDHDQGRKTLVPGFMAGIESMHERFGVLPFSDLFEPAIWYAENGVTISHSLSSYFRSREKQLSRTENGRNFIHQVGDHLPQEGEKFIQRDLSKTLRAVAQQGARYMYAGSWGRHYVEAVRAEGGKITLEDMERYHPIWQEPLSTTFAGHQVFGPGQSSEGGYQALEALNLIEELKIDKMSPYWKDPDSFRLLSKVLNVTDVLPQWMLDRARAKGVNLKREDRASKTFAATLAPLVNDFFTPPKLEQRSEHTAGVVVIDRQGNVAALVHSINTSLWGSTGIVVDGIPVADTAAITQATLARITPGDRVPDSMVPIILTRNGKPTLAVAITGYAIGRETVRIILGLVGNNVDVVTLMTAPPLVIANGNPTAEFLIPSEGYDPVFLDQLRATGSTIEMITKQKARSLRGIGVLGVVDATSGVRRSVEVPDLFSFAASY